MKKQNPRKLTESQQKKLRREYLAAFERVAKLVKQRVPSAYVDADEIVMPDPNYPETGEMRFRLFKSRFTHAWQVGEYTGDQLIGYLRTEEPPSVRDEPRKVATWMVERVAAELQPIF